MDVQRLNEVRQGVYCGACVVRMSERGLPEILIRHFSNTPEAMAFVEEIYAAGTGAEFSVYENWSYLPA